MSDDSGERIVPVAGKRIELETEIPFETLRRAFEREVPPLDEAAFDKLLNDGAEWRRFVLEAGGNGIHSFVTFWRHSPTPVMTVGGSDAPSAVYLIGDYATAARMFRHDPGVMLYVPLRVELHVNRSGRTVFSVEQPSSQLVSFQNNKITQTGYELDRMLGDLIEELGLPRPSVLRR
ncbi:hypothetical protein ACFVWR_07825 [Leifsonia sp. NPDC058292]|uniref:hypothetical protein n=1 Tax=Leifsonia sp. NPDC058292 TaxID=3346428 RepID=UPI0036D81208